MYAATDLRRGLQPRATCPACQQCWSSAGQRVAAGGSTSRPCILLGSSRGTPAWGHQKQATASGSTGLQGRPSSKSQPPAQRAVHMLEVAAGCRMHDQPAHASAGLQACHLSQSWLPAPAVALGASLSRVGRPLQGAHHDAMQAEGTVTGLLDLQLLQACCSWSTTSGAGSPRAAGALTCSCWEAFQFEERLPPRCGPTWWGWLPRAGCAAAPASPAAPVGRPPPPRSADPAEPPPPGGRWSTGGCVLPNSETPWSWPAQSVLPAGHQCWSHKLAQTLVPSGRTAAQLLGTDGGPTS